MQKPGEKLYSLITLLITWALLLGFFLAYESYFVAGQRQFLIDREFRTLGSLSNQLNAQFDRARISAESSVKLVTSAKSQRSADLGCQSTSNSKRCFQDFLNLYLGDVLVRDNSPETVRECWTSNVDRVPLKALPADYRLTLEIQCFTRQSPQKAGDPDPSSAKRIYRLNITPWIQQAFQYLSEPFEDILIVDDSGHVLFQQSPTEPRIPDLRPIVASSTEAEAKQKPLGLFSIGDQQHPSTGLLNQEQATKAGSAPLPESDETTAPNEKKLLIASGVIDVFIGGKRYKLFSQPTTIALANYPGDAAVWPLALCGLQRSSSLDALSHSLPYSTLIWLTLSVMVLLSISWPLFKLQYMSHTERFSPREGWYLILALFLMATAAIVMLLNESYISHSQNMADREMGQLANKIRENFKLEIQSAYQQLRDIPSDRTFKNAWRNSENPGLYGTYLSATSIKLTYPYFEIAFWANCKGRQLLKFDVRAAPTPPTDISPFSFFKSVTSDIEWGRFDTADKPRSCLGVSSELEALDHVYLQPTRSPNTDEFAPVLAAPFKDDSERPESGRIALQALTLRPMSVVDPVLPPGYAFAVIDKHCDILFHSDSFRDMKENFCEESKNKRELRPWLVGGIDTALDISYAGRTERGYITGFPLPNLHSQGNAFLIVFQEGDRPLTLNLAIILVCSILLAAYFLVLVAGAIAHLSWRSGLVYAPNYMWPRPENAVAYLQVFGANALLFSMYLLRYRRVYEAPLIALTLEVVVLAFVFALSKLSGSPRYLSRGGLVLTVVACLALGFFYWRWPSASSEWRILLYVSGILGIFAILTSGKHPLVQRLINSLPPTVTRPLQGMRTQFAEVFGLFPRTIARLVDILRKRFAEVYAFAAISLIACVALVPCLGFFKYAYDAVSEISLKHDQVRVSERLLARRDRIRSDYEILRAPKIALQRLNARWDRYDKATFHSNCEPGLSRDSSDPCNVTSETNRGVKPSIERLNNWIEKVVAQATLTFPSNETGSEMSRLGVASTDAGGAWERSWVEMDPTHFTLRWKPTSRLPNFDVTSSYPQWKGLTGGASFGLGLFLLFLFLWLVNLTKRIFLTDVEGAPRIETVNWRDVADIKTNSIVIGRAQSGKTKHLKTLAGLGPNDWRDLRTELRKEAATEDKCSSAGRSVMILDHFEFNIRDRDCNRKRLELIERLLYEDSCKIVTVSTVDPLYFLSEEAGTVLSNGDPNESQRLVDRWARVLSKFKKVNLAIGGKDRFLEELGKFAERQPNYSRLTAWVSEECGPTSWLRNLGIGVLNEFQTRPPKTREQLIEIVLDRANAYYHVLWSGLTGTERLVLYQLALDGWANPKNTSAIQQLERKQLICKAPMYRIMNDSFRRFIESAEHASEIANWEKGEQQSTWRALRFVIFVVLIGGGVWLLYAQAQLFQVGAGYLTAIATLLTAVAGLAARSKRTPAAQSEPKGDDSSGPRKSESE